jgi:hypothetical protein
MMRTLRRIRLPAALLTMAWLATNAVSQEIRIFGRPGGPFQNYAVPLHWSQRELTLRNDGDRSGRVKVACEPRGMEDTGMLFSRVVEMPPRSLRHVRLAVRPEELRPGDRKLGGLPLTPLTWRTWDLAADRQQAPVSYGAAIVPPRRTCVGIMFAYDDTPESDNDRFLYLQDLDQDPLQDVTLMVHSVRRDQRPPNHWYGYDMLDVLITGRSHWSELAPSERTALLDWTRRGGVLVVTAGEQFHRVLSGELASAAGVEVVGEHRVESITVNPRSDGSEPATVRPAWPAIFAELMPTSAEVLRWANDLPLLTQNDYGDGVVFVLAAPLGAVEDRSLHSLWQDVNIARRTLPTVNADAFAIAGRDTLKEIAGVRAPGRLWPAGLLAVLAGGSIVASLLLRRLGRSEITWIVLVPLCLVLAGAFYGWSRMRGNPERLTTVGLITQQPDGRSRVQTLTAYHSGSGGREDATFSAALTDGVIRDVGETLAGAISQREIRTDWTIRLPPADLPSGTSRALARDAAADLQPLETRLTFGPDGLTGTIENRLPADVTGVVLYAGRRTYRLPAIPAGESTAVTVDDEDLLQIVRYERPERGEEGARPRATGEFTGALAHNPVDRLRNDLLSRLLSVPAPQTRVSSQPTLIAYTPHTPAAPLDGVDDARGWSVVTAPLSLRAPESGAQVRIPAGLTQMELDSLGTATWDAVRHEFLVTPRDGKLQITVRFPRAIGPVSESSARLRVDIRAMNNRMTVYGLRPEWNPRDRRPQGRTELETFDDPSGVVTLEVENIERFATGQGTYRFLLDVKRTGRTGESLLEAGTVPKWWLRSVDVTLEGQAGE